MLYISLRPPTAVGPGVGPRDPRVRLSTSCLLPSHHVRTACAAAGSVRLLWRSQELDKVYEELDEKDEALTAETQRRCPMFFPTPVWGGCPFLLARWRRRMVSPWMFCSSVFSCVCDCMEEAVSPAGLENVLESSKSLQKTQNES